MALYLPIRAISRSQNVRVGGQKVIPGTTYYVDISSGATMRDLAHHSAIGAYVVVGPLTATSTDQVVVNGGTVTAGTGLTVNVTAGEIRSRSTDAYVGGAAATNFALTAANATQDRTDLIHWDSTTGAVGKTDGTLAAAGQSQPPAIPTGKVALATVLVPATATVPSTIVDIRPRP